MYHLLKGRRAVAEKNCEIIGIPSGDIDKVVKSSFRQTFCSYLESFYVKNIDQKFLDENVDVVYMGERPDTNACFMVSAHFGAWEFSPYIMTKKLGLKGAAVARKIKDPKVDKFILSQRVNSDVAYIHHRNATDAIREYMDRGEAVGVLLDHSSMPKDSMTVPFFGLETTFIKGIPLLSVRRDYPILPAFILRENGKYKLITYPLIYPDKSLKPKERAYDIALKINRLYEEMIRQYPDQWYLIHKRFKRVADENGKLRKGIYS
jgi:KDO2-lipid IV(A) lauroyltransferase